MRDTPNWRRLPQAAEETAKISRATIASGVGPAKTPAPRATNVAAAPRIEFVNDSGEQAAAAPSY
jgi:hypothetical protein